MPLNNVQLTLLKDFLNSDFAYNIIARGKTTINKIKKIEFDNSNIYSTIAGSNKELYKIAIEIDEDNGAVDVVCTCPYYENNFEPCKHIAATLLKLLMHEKSGSKETASPPKNTKTSKALLHKTNDTLPIVYMEYKLLKLPGYWDIRELAPRNLKKVYEVFQYIYSYEIKELDNGKKFCYEETKGKVNTVVEKIEKRNIVLVGCNCTNFKAIDPCEHIYALLMKLENQKGKFYFNQFEDYTIEKNNLLKPFDININDEIATDFNFNFNNSGVLYLAKVPNNILPKYSANAPEWQNLINKLPAVKTKKENVTVLDESINTSIVEPFDTAILFNLNESAFNGLRIEGYKITQRGDKFSYTQNKLKTRADLYIFNNAPSGLKSAMFNITEEALLNTLKVKANTYSLSNAQPFRGLTEEQKNIINWEYKKAVEQLAPYLTSWNHLYYLPNNQTFSKTNIKTCTFISTPLQYKIVLKANENIIWLEVNLFLQSTNECLNNYTIHKFLIKQGDSFYMMPENFNEIKNYFPNNKLVAPIAAKKEFISNIVLPLTTQFEIDYGNVIKKEFINSNPQPRIYLSELNEKFLLIRPKWLYNTYELDNDNESTTIVEVENGLININRNKEIENQLNDKLRELHPSFQFQNNEYFYLHFDQVMNGNWFLEMYKKMQKFDIPILGMNNLKRIKYNTNKGTMNFNTGSGTDWFDIKIEVSYGDQIVPLAILRKAILNNQDFILLGDGTLGMLPQEWIKKFATIMKMGTIQGNDLHVSKLHWTLIDELYQQQDGEEILKEIEIKKQKLKEIENVKTLKIPTNIKATLRDYQKSGFQWMNMLDEMGWGGCLADDMGLGKTLQTLTFLSGIQKKYKNETHLIVCPTSLIFNWESEILKFTPHLNYHINYGSERELKNLNFKKVNIIITSYGILRSDIEQFTKIKFGYIILDESQAIKNHLSQTAKAVALIKSRNRLILSGTPVQNNTFDLYSQFNFINPGLLGNMEFFKTEFANAIDKNNDKEKTNELRKIVYPFMLRRTKEQVAKDLPAKTETILWCEMEINQRKIYDSFKDEYRKKILEKIKKDGFAKAAIFILAGLTKLRQICDSPAILNEDIDYPNESVKINELMREIGENASNHKSLVFSQFTSMLNLIATELTKRNIKFYYLDGGTKVADRKLAVENFQKNDDVKVFLISLKAGGVGLNLTAADYVYMVDPWWNPAAEQQAIDRTHRIGQTKAVFAYKLICKNSIEEKILELQNKKKSLSADLISDDNGFVKKLTKDDVAYLFS